MLILNEQDVIIQAPTVSGKTFVFGMSAIESLDSKNAKCNALK